MREVKKEGSNLIWKIGFVTMKSYCTCGARVDISQHKGKCYCASCGKELTYWNPNEDEEK